MALQIADYSISSMRAEYQAMYAEIQELVWLWWVLSAIGRPEDESTLFFIDSQRADDLALNPVLHNRSKRIEIKYHWILEHMVLVWVWHSEVGACESTHQAADLFTKVLCGPMFETQASVVVGSKRSTSKPEAYEGRWR